MTYDKKKCKDCIMNGDCIYQRNDTVEDCMGESDYSHLFDKEDEE